MVLAQFKIKDGFLAYEYVHTESGELAGWGVDVAEKIPSGAKLAKCSICGANAVFIDGQYPYMMERNKCLEHAEKWQKESKAPAVPPVKEAYMYAGEQVLKMLEKQWGFNETQDQKD